MLKKIMIISIIFVLLFTISSVSANDVNMDNDDLNTVDLKTDSKSSEN